MSQHIPTEMGQLIGLKECDLGFNLLTGSIPNEISALTNLEVLRVRGIAGEEGRNEISGTFPAALGDLPNLKCFDATGTLMTGIVPEGICDNCYDLSTPDVHANVQCAGVTACSCCVCDSASDQCKLGFIKEDEIDQN